jgi:hypothetical protein
LDDLDPEIAKLPQVQAFIKANPKAKEIVFGSEVDETMDLEEDIDEAIAKRGKVSVYEDWARQCKTDYQNKKAAEKAMRATAADKRKGGEVLRVKL